MGFLAYGDIPEPIIKIRTALEVITREVWSHAGHNATLASQVPYIEDRIRNIAMTDKINRLSPNVIAHCKTRKSSTESRFTVGASCWRKMESPMRHVYVFAVIS